MSADHTQFQSDEDIARAKDLSLQKTKPPATVPGYETQRFLGAGAYGEVWVGVDQTTGRRVAIKFYTHGSQIDWSLLSREVEKLAVLSADRYVVQLLDVGWDASPPYYVMDYIENGSLEDALVERGHFPTAEAVEMFEEIAVGLRHLHSKGVLHCDLKPANVLLDEDDKPRLADFGQSRLSHEQSPALGTLFYMAPEQADMNAVADARWDVYALGALLYRMLTGNPPHRTEENIDKIQAAKSLDDRLLAYRSAIKSSTPPTQHRHLSGVDRALADIVDRCVTADPKLRYPSVESVIEALHRRAEMRARRPLTILGLVLPFFLLFVMALFGLRGYRAAMSDSDRVVTRRVRESNEAHAQAVAANVAREMERYFHAVETVANDAEFVVDFEYASVALDELSQKLSDPDISQEEANRVRDEFLAHPARQPLQSRIEKVMDNPDFPPAASWVTVDHHGVHMADDFDKPPTSSPVGKNYAWRTYFTGLEEDMPRDERPPPGLHVTGTFPSPVFQSTATFTWKIAVSRSVMKGDQFLGVVALTVEMGSFTHSFLAGDANEQHSERHTVLVGGRAKLGAILQHPLFATASKKELREFSDDQYNVSLDRDLGIRKNGGRRQLYRDPLGKAPGGEKFDRNWIAATVPVKIDRGRHRSNGNGDPIDTGLIVLVQEDYDAAIEPIHRLGERLVREGLVALTIVLVVIFSLWFFVVRILGREPSAGGRATDQRERNTPSPQSFPTLAAGKHESRQ